MLIGHEKIFDRLKGLGLEGKLHHAQLFIGPEHVGKTTVALQLATLLQGTDKLSADTVLLLDDGEYLSIESIRTVVERANQSHSLPYLIFVIENLGRMKAEAVNALLKTLEEPHEDILFFLTAHQEDDVLPTLRSRCHVTTFQTVSDDLLREACEDNVYTDQLLFFAMGRPGKLRRLLDDKEYFEAHQEIFQGIAVFLERPTTAGVFALGRKYEAHPLLGEMLDILLRRVHSLARSHVLSASSVERIEICKQDLKGNVNRKLLLDNLLLPFIP